MLPSAPQLHLPPRPKPACRRFNPADLGLNLAFTVEMLLRVASMGGPLAYLSHPWNVFDCLMVAAGYTTFIPVGSAGGAGLEGVKALRALRALRPLRTITRWAAPGVCCLPHVMGVHTTHLSPQDK